MTTIRVLNLDEVMDYFDDLEVLLREDVWTIGAQEGIDTEVEEYQDRVPVWRGDLRDSIDGPVQLTNEGMEAFVGPKEPYAQFVEFPTRRRFVPAKYIGEWAQDHGFGYTGLVVSGRAQPFVRKSESEGLSDAADRLTDTVVESIEDFLQDRLR